MNLNQKLIFGEQKLKIDKKKYWVKRILKIESALLTNELIEERIEDIKYDEDLLNTYV